MFVSDWQDHGLNRGKPNWEISGKVFNYYRKKSFNRSHNCGVDHYDFFHRTLFIYTMKVKAVRHVEIELYRGHLPLSIQRVYCQEIQFRPIKGGFSLCLKSFYFPFL